MKYVVKAGDNPWKFAKNHGISVEDLVKANDIKDSKKLAIGDVLTLPAGVESKGAPVAVTPAVPAAAATVTAPAAGDSWELYTIKSGDNPWNIAKRLKVDHQKIMSLNQGLDFTKLNIGQQIKVPKKQG
jgi:LysM repeat protein